MTALLEIRGVRAGYDTGDVLHGIDLDLLEGEVVAAARAQRRREDDADEHDHRARRPRAGSIKLDGRELAGSGAHEIARAGIAIVPQGRRIFARLTVEENLKLARRAAGGRRVPNRRWTTSTRCFRACGSGGGIAATSSPAASSRWSRSAVRCIASPRVLLFDEPSEGLAPLHRRPDHRRRSPACANAGCRRSSSSRTFMSPSALADRVAIMTKGEIVVPRDDDRSSAATAPQRRPCSACRDPET